MRKKFWKKLKKSPDKTPLLAKIPIEDTLVQGTNDYAIAAVKALKQLNEEIAFCP